MAEILGIDVSHFQGAFDWSKAKSQGYQFGYIKATEGETEVDPRFSYDSMAADKAGVLNGAYHFFHPGKDAMAQALHFCKTVGSLKGKLPPVLDWEVSDYVSTSTQISKAMLWLSVVEQNLGKTPMVYGPRDFLLSLKLPYNITKYPLWLAEYGVKTGKTPAPWMDYQFWQYTETGGLDKDVFLGSIDELKALAT